MHAERSPGVCDEQSTFHNDKLPTNRTHVGGRKKKGSYTLAHTGQGSYTERSSVQSSHVKAMKNAPSENGNPHNTETESHQAKHAPLKVAQQGKRSRETQRGDIKGNTGAGWVTTTNGATLETGHTALGKWMEVADAEVYRACEAARQAAAHEDAEEIWICLDNQGIVDQLHNPQTQNSTSQDIIDETKRALNTWKSKDDRRHIQVLWVPGHVGLEGNEQADAQAKLGCLRSNFDPCASLAGAQRWRRDQLHKEYKKWWKEQEGYHPLDSIPFNPPFCVSGYKGLDRTELGHNLAARTGHGHFDQYHNCFNHQCPHKCTRCNQPKE
ncbi:putative double-stranded RNA/RNA-DNA hybrid binding protein [Ceratocystis lukuohia]|uniref:Double-stranded RNA/RNA-DNA hybrid binding protein n=1 Tax=Ceratocystis lukuohia TaxID=2019550 RepID=A0ABR4MFV7_9PEZI